MCLYTKEREPRIADRDITCYNIVSVRGGKYYTPIVGRRIAKRYINGKRLYFAHGKSSIRPFGPFTFFSIGKGFIHTYGIVEEAFRNRGINEQVYECIIPKGAEYFKDFETSELASKVILFVRKLDRQIILENNKNSKS